MTDDTSDSDANVGIKLAHSIYPLLTEQPPHVVAAALADLLSLMLAGHFVEGSAVQTKRLREDILTEHIKAVKALIPLQEAMLKERMAGIARPN